MPLTHALTFPVRSYECDIYGHVNQANYLRYMQEAALFASSSVGYDDAAYEKMGTIWFIRELEIEYQNSYRFGDQVAVNTWVGDFRRVRSRRFYDLLHATTGQVAAKASADWIYLNRETQLPAQISDEMVAAFAPNPADRVEATARREKFPDVPPVPPGAFTMTRRVEWRDIDMAQHVNHANYLTFMEECAVQAAAARGWPFARMWEAGFGIMARKHRIEYRMQARLGDELNVTTFLAEPRRSTVVRHFTVTRASDNALIARAKSQFMCVDVVNSALMRFPPLFVEDFADSIAENA
ncbi:MAG: YbgC/FadM family acyl-CoA thioesterase [Pleurocapsa minor GSE-CHR-MK-17-07R]|jgi:acyl-CoA thioester hydrolase|nr:YbgC/FadM family acyl-CoA thioesterase [Pleurocapsa minor GSE-CHR-MK 17-07R]